VSDRRLGLTVPITGLPVAETTVPLAQLAEKSGFTDIWSAEVDGADGLSPLAAVAATSSNLRLGTAILPAFTRPPALFAMSAASLQALSGGRFILGLGTSTKIVVGNWMGIPFEKPVKRIRETVEIIREAIGGKKVSVQGETVSSTGFRLTADPTAPVPIYLAALGPRMLHMTGEIAEGVLLFLFTPEGASEAIAKVQAGAAAAGKDPAAIDSVIRIGVAIDEDEETLRFMLRRLTTAYAMVDVYNASLRRQGFEKQAIQIADLWRSGDRDGAAASVTDEMLESLYIFGDAETCKKRIQLFRDAGIKTPVIMPISVEGDPAVRLEKTRSIVTTLGNA
jgi:probable F420-dependent oxidoreductase